jgi:hypothetical protein
MGPSHPSQFDSIWLQLKLGITNTGPDFSLRFQFLDLDIRRNLVILLCALSYEGLEKEKTENMGGNDNCLFICNTACKGLFKLRGVLS